MAGLNRVMLIGHVGRDPELRYTNTGKAVCNFSFATSEGWGDKETTEWHQVVAWEKTAENLAEYAKKGTQLYIEGRNQTRDYEKDGVKHYKTEVVVRQFQFLGKKGDGPPAQAQSVDDAWEKEQQRIKQGEAAYDVGDLGPPLDIDDNPLSPGD